MEECTHNYFRFLDYTGTYKCNHCGHFRFVPSVSVIFNPVTQERMQVDISKLEEKIIQDFA